MPFIVPVESSFVTTPENIDPSGMVIASMLLLNPFETAGRLEPDTQVPT